MKRTSLIKFGVVAALIAGATSASAANKLIVKDAAGTTDKFVVSDTGRIGVNVVGPEAGLHIKGATYPDNTLRVEGNEVTGGAGYLAYNKRTTGLPLADDRLGFFLFGTINGATPMHAAGIESKAEAAWTVTSTPSYFSFLTTASGTTARTERLRLTGAGNVGIGTSTPGQRLEVNGGVRLNTSTAKPTCDSTVRGTLWLNRGTTGVADTFEACVKDSSENYSWRNLL